ncbi:MAG: hypothetical protein R6W72_13955 [Desulfurivibrionaceae bacterium]
MMKKNTLRILVSAVLMISSILLLINCGGGSDDPPVPVVCTTCESVVGSWQVSENVNVTASSPVGYCSGSVESYVLTASQNDCQLTVTDIGARSYSGQICDRTIKWTGSYPEDGGTTVVTAMTATLSADGLSLSGVSEWNWSDDTGTCKGTSTFTASKSL